MREIRFILFTIVVLTVTGILIVSCSTPTQPPQTVKRIISVPVPVATNGKTMTRMVTMSVALPPKTNRFYQVMWDAPTNTVGMWVPAAKPKDSLAPIPVVFQSVVIWPNYYRLELGLTSDAFHTLADNIKTNSVLVSVSNMPPVCALRVIAVGNGIQSPASTEIYRGVFSNGNIYAGAYYWVADSNSVYRLSNSPLTTIRWTNLTVISNRSGLVSVPLPEKMGQLRWSAER